MSSGISSKPYCFELITWKLQREAIQMAASKPSLQELLRSMLESIAAAPIRERIRKMIKDDCLLSPLTQRALKKEAQELISLLQEGGKPTENTGN